MSFDWHLAQYCYKNYTKSICKQKFDYASNPLLSRMTQSGKQTTIFHIMRISKHENNYISEDLLFKLILLYIELGAWHYYIFCIRLLSSFFRLIELNTNKNWWPQYPRTYPIFLYYINILWRVVWPKRWW
jgi:hypothetical protein